MPDQGPSPIVSSTTVDMNCECCKCGLLSIVVQFPHDCRCLGIYEDDDCDYHTEEEWYEHCFHGPLHFETSIDLRAYDPNLTPENMRLVARETVFFTLDKELSFSSGRITYASRGEIPLCEPGTYLLDGYVVGTGVRAVINKVFTASAIYSQTVTVLYTDLTMVGCCDPELSIYLYDVCGTQHTSGGYDVAADLIDFDDVVITLDNGEIYTLTYDEEHGHSNGWTYDLPCGYSFSYHDISSVTIGGEPVTLTYGDFYWNPSGPGNVVVFDDVPCRPTLNLRLHSRYYIYINLNANECVSGSGDTMTVYVKNCDELNYGGESHEITLTKVPGGSNYVYYGLVPWEDLNMYGCDCTTLYVSISRSFSTYETADFHREYSGMHNVFALSTTISDPRPVALHVVSREAWPVSQPYTVTLHISYYDGYSTQYYDCTISSQYGPGGGCTESICLNDGDIGIDSIDAPSWLMVDSNTTFPMSNVVYIEVTLYDYSDYSAQSIAGPGPERKAIEAAKDAEIETPQSDGSNEKKDGGV